MSGVLVTAAVALAACGGGGGDAGPDCTAAPGGTGTIAVRSKFRPGDERSVEVSKSRGGSYTASLRVLGAGARDAHLRWTVEEVHFPPLVGAVGRVVTDRIEKEVGKLVVDYRTDRTGAVSEVENLPALRSQMQRGFDIVAELESSDDPGEARAIEAARKQMESDAVIVTFVAADLVLPHDPYGLELAPDVPQEFEYELGNPFGGEPIPGTATYTLVDLADANGCAVVEAAIEADRDALVKVLARTLGRIARDVGQEAPDESLFAGFRVRHTIRYLYDPGSGWVERVEARKHVTTNEGERTERTTVSLD